MQKNDETIVWFKSASRDDYRGKILTALSLPINFYLNTWYDEKWVDENLWKKIEKSEELCQKDGIIVFVDQTKNPPVFYPLRHCTFYSAQVNGSRAFLWLKMGEYLKFDGDNLKAFNEELRKKALKLPTQEHSYAQLLDISKALEQVKSSSSITDLQSLVEQISSAVNSFDNSIFYWFDIRETKSKQNPDFEKQDGVPVMSLRARKRYRLLFNYLAPKQIADPKSQSQEPIKISFKFSPDNFYPAEKELSIPANSRIYVHELIAQCIKPGEAEIEIARNDDLKNAPNPVINVKISSSKLSYLSGALIFVGLVIIALPQVIIIPSKLSFLSPILSLIVGPAISAVAVWLTGKQQ